MPYKAGLSQIDILYKQHDIKKTTAKHTFTSQVSAAPVNAQISVPGYKHKAPNYNQDFKAEFQYGNSFIAISHSDIALDIMQKCIDNPSLINAIAQFIYAIGLNGHSVVVPSAFIGMTNNPPNAAIIKHLTDNTANHRINGLTFGIPIDHYPSLLYWVSLNEDVNYHPSKKSTWGGRRTAFKRYLEAVYLAEKCINENWISNSNINPSHLTNLELLIERIKDGRGADLANFPVTYSNLFTQMDANYQH